ncbi:MAG: radical SAM protein [bacterium]|nr:radical SAM protein [bacterium]
MRRLLMDLRLFLSKIKKLAFILAYLLRRKGVKYTYNYYHFLTFWGRRNDFKRKLLYSLSPYPSYIEIEVTTRCNLRCIMCEHTYWNEPNRDMSFQEFKQIVDQFPKLKWIGLTGIGESFLNKDFIRMLKYVKSKSIYVELYDTFYFIDKKIAKELIEIEVDKIFVSLDAATKETYEYIRVGSDFEKVVNNVKNLFQLKREKNAFSPIVEFHYIISKANSQEVLPYIELVHSLINEKVNVQFTRMLHEFTDVSYLFTEVPEEIRQRIERRAKELGINVRWNADIPKVKPPITKCIEWTMPFIFVSGHVVPCCSGNEAGRRDFQKETALGNVFKTSFKEIWRSQNYKEFKGMLHRGEVPIQCRNCCLYDIGDSK